MATDLEKIGKRIDALFKKAEDAEKIGSLQEAETFAAKAQELLAKYNLERADTQQAEPDTIEKELIKFEEVHDWNKNEARWLSSLYHAVARYNFGRVVITRHDKGHYWIWLVGEQMNRDMIKFIVHSVVPNIRTLRKKRWAEFKGQTFEKPNTFMRGYYLGAAQGIGSKLLKEWQAMQEQNQKMDALVRTSDLALTDSLAKFFPSLGQSRGKGLKGVSGAAIGRKDGSNMNIRKGVSSSSKSAGRLLN